MMNAEEIEQEVQKIEAELKRIEALENQVRAEFAKLNYQVSAQDRENAKMLLSSEERAMIEKIEQQEQLEASKKANSAARKVRMRRGMSV